MSKISRITLCAAAALLATTYAQAQSAGSFVGRIGLTKLTPHVVSGDLSTPSFPGTKTDVGGDTQATGGVTYMITDQIALDLPVGLGFTHEITGAGAVAGTGKLGEVQSLPLTALVQYRFNDANDKFRPYVGIGATYAKFHGARTTAAMIGISGGSKANPTTMSVQSKLTYSLQVGLSVALSDKLGLDFSLIKTPLSTTTTLSTGQKVSTKLDPTALTISLSHRF